MARGQAHRAQAGLLGVLALRVVLAREEQVGLTVELRHEEEVLVALTVKLRHRGLDLTRLVDFPAGEESPLWGKGRLGEGGQGQGASRA